MWNCKIAQDIVENKITHFHGQIETKPIILNRYKGKEGTFLKKFLIGEEFNMNRWRVTWDAIKKDIESFIGMPLVLTPKRDHPRVKDQENYRVGDIIDVGLDELKRTAWQVTHITDEKTIELIRNEEIRFGSPTVVPFSKDTVEKVNLGDGRIETTLHRFKGKQDAIVGDPAYGKEVDFIPAICDGTGEGCALKLMEVSAAVNYDDFIFEAEFENTQCTSKYATIKDGSVKVDWSSKQHQLLHTRNLPHSHVCVKKDGKKTITRWSEEKHAVVNSDNIDQLTIVPFVKKSLKKHFKGETINEIVGFIKQADASTLKDCVSRKIKIISDEDPKMKEDQVVAVAYSYCRKQKEGEIEDIIAEDIGETIFSIKDRIQEEIARQDELLHKIDSTKSKLKQLVS